MDSLLDSAHPPTSPRGRCIGVFDSGVGGLSVLRALHTQLPHAPLAYVADSGHAPYGERSVEYVLDRSRRIAAHLLDQGAAGLVVACNTATAIAVRTLREKWPSVPIVGVEPGLKPAAATTRNRRIGVMATTGTLVSNKFQALLQSQSQDLIVLPRACPGLARLIEQGDLDAQPLRDAIELHTRELRAARVDTVVLGCTHYTFVRHHIQTAMGSEVQIIDTADAVARHAAEQLGSRVAHVDEPITRLHTTGDANCLRDIANAWLPFPTTVERLDV